MLVVLSYVSLAFLPFLTLTVQSAISNINARNTTQKTGSARQMEQPSEGPHRVRLLSATGRRNALTFLLAVFSAIVLIMTGVTCIGRRLRLKVSTILFFIVNRVQRQQQPSAILPL